MPFYTDYQTIDSTVFDEKALNNAIKNILLTPIGSLPGKPTFGSQLNRLLFELDDYQMRSLSEGYIIDALAKWEKRLMVKDVEYNVIPEYNKKIMTISYVYTDGNFVSNGQVSFALTA
jgi:phage baseplate assembly protein W